MAERASLNRKQVLILLPYLKNGDGTAVALMNYYQALIKDNWNVDFLNLKNNDCEWSQMVKKNGGQIYEIPQVNKYSKLVRKYIEKIINAKNYDIVHVNIPGHVGYITLKIAKKAGVNIRLFHAHNPFNNLNIKTSVSSKIYDTLITKEATNLIACSESAGKTRFKERKFKVLKNVIDVNRFQYSQSSREKIRKSLKIEDKIVIGVVGRFSCQKNPYFLVKCFAELRKIEPKAFLLWVGDGELKNNVEKKLYDMGLERDVQFVGRKPNVQEWYSAMDLFFLPSVFEGMGIVFLEAQCTGLPCVGSSNVPIETEITELMHRISLKDNEKIWAIQMKKILDESINRKTRDKDFIDEEYTHDLTQNDLRDYYNYLLYKKEEN